MAGARISYKDGHEDDLANGSVTALANQVNALTHSAAQLQVTLDSGEVKTINVDTIASISTLATGGLPDREEPGLVGR